MRYFFEHPLVEPIVDEFEGGFEAISTEDMQARLMGLNEANEDWSTMKWWRNKRDECERYEACDKCEGDPSYEFDENQPELCKCVSSRSNTSNEGIPSSLTGCGSSEELDGKSDIHKYSPSHEGILPTLTESYSSLDDDENFYKYSPSLEGVPPSLAGEMSKLSLSDEGSPPSPAGSKEIRKVTVNFMKEKRLNDWLGKMEMEVDMFSMLESNQVLPEMLQNYETPQVIVGCDVESLYPSLDIDTCCTTIYEEIMGTAITWQDIDYL